jgi:hypothetical protein
MKIVILSPQVRKVCAAGVATLMLSVLAHAAPGAPGVSNGNGNGDQNGNNPHLGSGPVPVVPEANTGLVLIPVMAAVLFFSTRRVWLAKRSPAADGQKTSGETRV